MPRSKETVFLTSTNHLRNCRTEDLCQCFDSLLDCFGLFSAVRDAQNQIVDFRIAYLNRAACDNNLLTPQEQIGRPLLAVLPFHRASGLLDAYRRVTETGEPFEAHDFAFRDCYGGELEQRWFDIRAWKVGDGFAASWRDVTNLHHAAAKFANITLSGDGTSSSITLESDDSLTALLDNLPVLLCIWTSSRGAYRTTSGSAKCWAGRPAT